MKTQRILFQEFSANAIDDEGISSSDWQEVRKAWASVEHKNGSQKWGNSGYSAEVTDLFTIQHVPGWEPDSSMRLVWKDKIYDIESVDNIRESNLDVEIRAIFKMRVRGNR